MLGLLNPIFITGFKGFNKPSHPSNLPPRVYQSDALMILGMASQPVNISNVNKANSKYLIYSFELPKTELKNPKRNLIYAWDSSLKQTR